MSLVCAAFGCARGAIPISEDPQLDGAPYDTRGDAGASDEPADEDADQVEKGAASEDAEAPTYGADGITDAGLAAPAFSYAVSNVNLAGIDLASAPSATLDCGVTLIDTSRDITITNWCGTPPRPVLRPQTDGPGLVVIPLSGFAIARASRLQLSGERAVLLLILGDAFIDGTIDASARGVVAGAGGDVECGASSGGAGAGFENLNGGGGGGGGFGSTGGAGGNDFGLGSAAGVGGVTRGNAELVPLLAGCGGGGGGGCAGTPGAGGGAVQMSASGAMVINGAVLANGGEGEPGCADNAGGAGGGSGGGILLEADGIYASGRFSSAAGGDGGPGQHDEPPGAGSTEERASGGTGQDGLFLGAGGGGGGFGRIRLRAATTCVDC